MRPHRDELSRAARLAFEGTVQGVAPGRATVRVDQLVRGPPAALPPGRIVQLVLAPREEVSAGDRAVFFVSSWELSDAIVLQSIGHRSAGAAPAAKRGARSQQPPAADLVVSGTVTRVKPLPSARGHVTEHDPRWHEATVSVSGTERGTPPGDEVIVRFPASTDVRWHQAPKLSPGQTGTFLLKRERSAAKRPVFTELGLEAAADAGARSSSPAAPAVKSRRPRSAKGRGPRRR